MPLKLKPNPVPSTSQAGQDSMEDDLAKFRARAKAGQAGKPTKLKDMNPIDRAKFEKEFAPVTGYKDGGMVRKPMKSKGYAHGGVVKIKGKNC